jgi:hypothetical protein
MGAFDDYLNGKPPAEPAKPSGAFDQMVAADSQRGDFWRAVKQTYQQVPELAYGITALGASAIETAMGEGGLATSAKNWSVGKMLEWKHAIQETSKESDDINFSWERAREGDYGALVDWLQYGVGYGVGQASQILATAGVGAIAGKIGLRAAVDRFAAPLVEKEAERLVMASMAEKGGKATAEQIAKAAALPEVRKAAVGRLASQAGAIGATGAYAFGMEGGEIGGDVAESSVSRGTQLTGSELAKAFGATMLAGTVEFAGDLLGLGAMMGKIPVGRRLAEATGLKGRAARGIVGGAMVAPAEGAQEFFQTGIEEWGKGKEESMLPWEQSPENQRQALNAAALGFVAGGVMGGGGGVLRAAEKARGRPFVPAPARTAGETIAPILDAPDVQSAVDAATAAYESDVGASIIAQVQDTESIQDGITLAVGAARDAAERAATSGFAYRQHLEQQADAAIAESLGLEARQAAEEAARPKTAMQLALERAFQVAAERPAKAAAAPTAGRPSTSEAKAFGRQIKELSDEELADVAERHTMSAQREAARAELTHRTAVLMARIPEEKPPEKQAAPPVRIYGQLPEDMSLTQLQSAAQLLPNGKPKNVAFAYQAAAAQRELAFREKVGQIFEGKTVEQMSVAALDRLIANPTAKRQLKLFAQAEKRRRAKADADIRRRIANPGIADELKAFAAEAGWAQKGGFLVRSKRSERAGDETVTRTQWIPRAEWWRGRPVAENEDFYRKAVADAIAGKPLGEKQKRVVNFLLGMAEEVGRMLAEADVDGVVDQGLGFSVEDDMTHESVDLAIERADRHFTEVKGQITKEEADAIEDRLFGADTRPAVRREEARAAAIPAEARTERVVEGQRREPAAAAPAERGPPAAEAGAERGKIVVAGKPAAGGVSGEPASDERIAAAKRNLRKALDGKQAWEVPLKKWAAAHDAYLEEAFGAGPEVPRENDEEIATQHLEHIESAIENAHKPPRAALASHKDIDAKEFPRAAALWNEYFGQPKEKGAADASAIRKDQGQLFAGGQAEERGEAARGDDLQRAPAEGGEARGAAQRQEGARPEGDEVGSKAWYAALRRAAHQNESRPKGKPSLSNNLVLALMSFADADSRWAERFSSGRTDDELRLDIGHEFGMQGGGYSQAHKGGENPKFYFSAEGHIPVAHGKPTLQGKALIDAVRALFKIPKRKAQAAQVERRVEPTPEQQAMLDYEREFEEDIAGRREIAPDDAGLDEQAMQREEAEAEAQPTKPTPKAESRIERMRAVDSALMEGDINSVVEWMRDGFDATIVMDAIRGLAETTAWPERLAYVANRAAEVLRSADENGVADLAERILKRGWTYTTHQVKKGAKPDDVDAWEAHLARRKALAARRADIDGLLERRAMKLVEDRLYEKRIKPGDMVTFNATVYDRYGEARERTTAELRKGVGGYAMSGIDTGGGILNIGTEDVRYLTKASETDLAALRERERQAFMEQDTGAALERLRAPEGVGILKGTESAGTPAAQQRWMTSEALGSVDGIVLGYADVQGTDRVIFQTDDGNRYLLAPHSLFPVETGGEQVIPQPYASGMSRRRDMRAAIESAVGVGVAAASEKPALGANVDETVLARYLLAEARVGNRMMGPLIIDRIYGPEHGEMRQRIMQRLTGENVSKEKSGVGVVKAALFKHFGIQGDSERAREEALQETLERLAYGGKTEREALDAGWANLSAEERAQVEREVGRHRFDENAVTWMQGAREGVQKWLASVSESVRAAFRKFVAFLAAVAVALNVSTVQEADAVARPAAQQQEVTVRELVERPKADFGYARPGWAARLTANWIMASGAHEGRSFLVADKNAGTLYAFGSDGKLIEQTAALYGESKADELTPEQWKVSVDKMRTADKVTPAGRWTVGLQPDSERGWTMDFEGGEGLAIHAVYLGNPKETRAQRLVTETAEDNFITYGCINVPKDYFERVLKPNFGDKHGLFIIPHQEANTERVLGIVAADMAPQLVERKVTLPAGAPKRERPSGRRRSKGKFRSRDLDALGAKERAAAERQIERRGADAARLAQQLELHQGTPWAKQTIQGLIVRAAIDEYVAGRTPDFASMLDSPHTTNAKAAAKAGVDGIWRYLMQRGLIGEAGKPANSVNSSFANCTPSADCARFCYAATGNYTAPNPIVKSELTSWAVENNPQRAGDQIAHEYKTTAEFYVKKALRLFDKGDGTMNWIPVIQRLNAHGIRVQVFSKNPDFLRAVPKMNLRLLSADKSNLGMVRANPDLPVAFVYSDASQIAFLNEIRDRVQVILPIKLGSRLLSKAELEELPAWTRPYQCPVNNGHRKIGRQPNQWTCGRCDYRGGVGCFYGTPSAKALEAIDRPAEYDSETRSLVEELTHASRQLRPTERRKLLGEIDRLISAIRAGVDIGTAGGSARENAAAVQGDDRGLGRGVYPITFHPSRVRETRPEADLARFEGEGGRLGAEREVSEDQGEAPPGAREPAAEGGDVYSVAALQGAPGEAAQASDDQLKLTVAEGGTAARFSLEDGAAESVGARLLGSVVTKTGEPWLRPGDEKRVYHGTSRSFNNFEAQYGLPWFYFSEKHEMAEKFAASDEPIPPTPDKPERPADRKVTIATKDGPANVDAWDVGVPGLVVTYQVKSGLYSVTHEASGYAAGGASEYFVAVMEAARRLGRAGKKLGVDWRRGAEFLDALPRDEKRKLAVAARIVEPEQPDPIAAMFGYKGRAGIGVGSNIRPAYLAIKKPIDLRGLRGGTHQTPRQLLEALASHGINLTIRDMPFSHRKVYQMLNSPSVAEKIMAVAQERGYDGLIFNDEFDARLKAVSYIVFSPSQVIPAFVPRFSRNERGSELERRGARVAAMVKALEKRVDRAYRRGDPRAEDWDAILSELKAIEEGIAEALQEGSVEDVGEPSADDVGEPAGIEENLVRLYWEYLQGGLVRGGEQETIAAMRDALFAPEGIVGSTKMQPRTDATDEEVLAAAKDAFEAWAARQARNAGAYYTTDAKGQPLLHLDTVQLVDPQPFPGAVRGGQAYQHSIYRDGRPVGVVSLVWEQGRVKSLLHILTYDEEQGRGVAEAVVRGILMHNRGGLHIMSIQDTARGFWEKMGTEYLETEGTEPDGYITPESYRAARGAEGDQEARRRAREAGTRPAAVGEGAPRPGDARFSPADEALDVDRALNDIRRAGTTRYDEQAQSDLAVLERELGPFSSTGRVPRGLYRPVRLPDDSYLQELAGTFGRRVLGISFDESRAPPNSPLLTDWQGVSVGADSGIIGIRYGARRPSIALTMHELSHEIEREDPETFNELVEALRPYIRQEEYGRRFAAVYRGMPDARIRGEFVAEVMSDGAMYPKFWDYVGQYSPELLRKLVGAVRRLLDRVARGLGMGYKWKTAQYVTDFDAVMNEAARALAKYHDKRALADMQRAEERRHPAFQRDDLPAMDLDADRPFQTVDRIEDIEWKEMMDYFSANVNERRVLIYKPMLPEDLTLSKAHRGGGRTWWHAVVAGSSKHLRNGGKADSFEDAARIAWEALTLLPPVTDTVETRSAMYSKRMVAKMGGRRGKQYGYYHRNTGRESEYIEGEELVDGVEPSEGDIERGPDFSREGTAAPVFYYALDRQLVASPMKAGPAKAWRDYIKGLVAKGLVKQDEVNWSGIDDLLQIDTEGHRIQREELLFYLRQMNKEIGDVVAGEAIDAEFEGGGAPSAAHRASNKVNELRVQLDALGYDVEFEANGPDAGMPLYVLRRSDRSAFSFGDRFALGDALHVDELPDGPRELAEDIYQEAQKALEDEDGIVAQHQQSLQPRYVKTRYETYGLPGSEPGTYREILMTLPSFTMEGVAGRVVFEGRWREAVVDEFMSEIAEEHPEVYLAAIEEDGVRNIVEFSGAGETARDSIDNFARMNSGDVTYTKGAGPVPMFTSAHWQQGNVVAHIRADVVKAEDGKSYLRVIEIQSDWAQRARKVRKQEVVRVATEKGISREEADKLVARDFGFSEPRAIRDASDKVIVTERHYRDLVKKMLAQITEHDYFGFEDEHGALEDITYNPITWEQSWQTQRKVVPAEFRRLAKEYLEAYDAWRRATREQVAISPYPKAPFVDKTEAWVSLAVKRALRYAADKGLAGVVFASGKQNLSLYEGIRRRVKRIEWQPEKRQLNIVFKPTRDGHGLQNAEPDRLVEAVGPKELPEYVGENIAKQLLEPTPSAGTDAFNVTKKDGSVWRVVEGEKLRVGGEGLVAFYDKLLPAVASGVVRKLGGKLSKVTTQKKEGSPLAKKEMTDTVVAYMAGDISAEEFIDNTGLNMTVSDVEADEDMNGAWDRHDARTRTVAKTIANRLTRQHGPARSTTYNAVELTPEMRDKALGGLPAFSPYYTPDLKMRLAKGRESPDEWVKGLQKKYPVTWREVGERELNSLEREIGLRPIPSEHEPGHGPALEDRYASFRWVTDARYALRNAGEPEPPAGIERPLFSREEREPREAAPVAAGIRKKFETAGNFDKTTIRQYDDYVAGAPELASAQAGPITVRVMRDTNGIWFGPGYFILTHRDFPQYPVPAHRWMDEWEPYMQSVEGVSRADYAKLPQEERAAIEARRQARTYAEKQFFGDLAEFYWNDRWQKRLDEKFKKRTQGVAGHDWVKARSAAENDYWKALVYDELGQRAFTPHDYPPADKPNHPVRKIVHGIKDNMESAIREARAMIAEKGWKSVAEAFSWFSDDRSHGGEDVAEAARAVVKQFGGTESTADPFDFVTRVLTDAEAEPVLSAYTEAELRAKERREKEGKPVPTPTTGPEPPLLTTPEGVAPARFGEVPKSPTGQGSLFSRETRRARRRGSDVRFSPMEAIGASGVRGDHEDGLARRGSNFVRDLLHSSGKLSWWSRTVGTPQHVAETNAEFRPVFDEGQAFIHDVSRFANEAADAANGDPNDPNAMHILPRIEQFMDFLKKHASNEDQERVMGALMTGTLWGGGDPLQGRIWTDEELRAGREVDGDIRLPAFTPMTEAQIKLYRQALNSTRVSLDNTAKSMIARHARQHDIGFDRDMSLEDVAESVRQTADNTITDLSVDLETIADEGYVNEMAQEAYEQAGEGAPGRRAAARVSAKLAEDAEKLREQIAQLEQLKKDVTDIEEKTTGLKNSGYFPAMRFGQYAVQVLRPRLGEEPEQLYFSMFDTQLKANLAKRELRREFGPDVDIVDGMISLQQFRLFRGLNLEMIEAFADNIVDESGGRLSKDPVVQGFIKAAASERSNLKRHLHRKGVAGYSRDLPRVLAAFTVSSARAAASGYHSADMARLAQRIRTGDVKDYAIDLVRYLQDPEEEAHWLRAFLFVQYLGGSIAHGMVNMTQPALVTVPYLSQFTTPKDAAAKVSSAAATKESELTGSLKDDFTRAKGEGVVAPQEIHQLRAEAGGLPVGSSLIARKLSFLWGSIYSITEQFNRKTTFIAAHRIAQDMSSADLAKAGARSAYEFAVNAVNRTQFIYNKGNRPAWARGPIGATVFTFKQFSISYLELAKRIYRNDKKAFALMMLLLIAAAGLEGLPFAEDIEDIVDTVGQWMGYATNSKKKLREWAAASVGMDLAQVAMKGVSGLPFMPVDISVRMGLQNLIPGTAALKPSEKSKVRDVLEMMGPAGQLVPAEGTMAGRAIERLAKGDVLGAVREGAPVAVQNVVKGAQMMDSGYATDYEGKRTVGVSPGEAAFKMVGLNPASVAREGEKMRLAKSDMDLQRRMEDEIAEKWARGVADGDREAVRDAMKKLNRWNVDNPELRVRITMQQIQQRVRDIKRTRAERTIKHAPPEIRPGVRDALR